MVKPNLGPGIRERDQEAIASKDESAMDDLHAIRTEFKSALATLLNEDGILAIPTVPGAPPKLGMDEALLEDFRARAFSLLSIAGMSGFCQASIPLCTRCGVPVSVSLLAGHGADRSSLSLPRNSRRLSKMRPPQPVARQVSLIWSYIVECSSRGGCMILSEHMQYIL